MTNFQPLIVFGTVFTLLVIAIFFTTNNETKKQISVSTRELKPLSSIESCVGCATGTCTVLADRSVSCPFIPRKRNQRAPVYDFFPYNGENYTLLMHLYTLREVVDRFIIVESAETFSGKARESTLETMFRQNMYFENMMDYIDHIVMPMGTTSDNKITSWKREDMARNVLVNHYLNIYPERIPDDALFIISDVDEIVRPEVVDFLANTILEDRSIVHVNMRFTYYDYSCECPQLEWHVRFVQVRNPRSGDLTGSREFDRALGNLTAPSGRSNSSTGQILRCRSNLSW